MSLNCCFVGQVNSKQGAPIYLTFNTYLTSECFYLRLCHTKPNAFASTHPRVKTFIQSENKFLILLQVYTYPIVSESQLYSISLFITPYLNYRFLPVAIFVLNTITDEVIKYTVH